MDMLGNSGWMPFIWFGLGLLLLIFEVMGASGFLLGAAVAAIAMAVITFAVDISIPIQISIYAVVAVIGTLVYYRFFRGTQPSNKNALPTRTEAMIGRRFALDEAIQPGAEIRVQLGDTMWRVASESDLDKGSNVEVVSTDNMRLVVAAVGD